MKERARFVISCGGTGGHLFPGFAVGEIMLRRGHEVTLCLAGRAVERSALPDWPGDLLFSGARQIPLRRPASAVAGLVRNAGATAGLLAAWRRRPPSALLAMGGYASLPPVLAARLLRVPVILHEANAVPGRAVSFLSRLANRTCLAFASAAGCLPRRQLAVTGMPVRTDLPGQPPLEGMQKDGFGLLIMGGSQGASSLNRIAVEAVSLLVASGMDDLKVVHIAGQKDACWVASYLRERGPRRVVVAPFIGQMGGAYASCDLAVCRSGAATCAELCLCGLPSLLVPLPGSVRDHQAANARDLQGQGAALCLEQKGLTPGALAGEISRLRAAPGRLAAMARAAAGLASPRAGERLADVMENEAKGSRTGSSRRQPDQTL